MKESRCWFELEPKIKIDMIGHVQTSNMHPTRQGNSYWILVLVKKGCRTLYANQTPIQIGGNQFFLLPPYTDQKPFQTDEHTAFFVHFFARGTIVDPPVRIDASRIILPSYGYLPYDFDIFSALRYLHDHTRSPYSNPDFISHQLRSLLMVISLQCQKHPKWEEGKKDFLLDELISFIKIHACSPLRAEDYEVAFGKSYHHINYIFKNHFNSTVKQYHMRLRMNHAAQLLLSGASLQETAIQCGFDDYYFFINSFKKEFGVSPAAYRRLHR